ncbi:HAD-IA family hydrolase [Kitasatospora phosalacinea]|uniref:HAD-IA family hydrolase n=1 Tax=Kitasatospora phosalacinea TaxID=2065 RepID=UPI00365B2826
MPFSPFHAVVFDFFGTLTPAVPSRARDEHAARSAAPLGIDAQRWRRAWDESWPERAVGGLGDLRETVTALAARCGVTEPEQAALWQACEARRAAQHELFALRPDALRVLETIRRRDVRIGVLSDCSTELADHWALVPAARWVDTAVFSCREGRRKPDPALYAEAMRRLGVTPERCLYVGDGDGRELGGAAAAGMTAVQLRAEDRAEHESYDRETDWTGWRATALTHIATGLDYPVVLQPEHERPPTAPAPFSPPAPQPPEQPQPPSGPQPPGQPKPARRWPWR